MKRIEKHLVFTRTFSAISIIATSVGILMNSLEFLFCQAVLLNFLSGQSCSRNANFILIFLSSTFLVVSPYIFYLQEKMIGMPKLVNQIRFSIAEILAYDIEKLILGR